MNARGSFPPQTRWASSKTMRTKAALPGIRGDDWYVLTTSRLPLPEELRYPGRGRRHARLVAVGQLHGERVRAHEEDPGRGEGAPVRKQLLRRLAEQREAGDEVQEHPVRGGHRFHHAIADLRFAAAARHLQHGAPAFLELVQAARRGFLLVVAGLELRAAHVQGLGAPLLAAQLVHLVQELVLARLAVVLAPSARVARVALVARVARVARVALVARVAFPSPLASQLRCLRLPCERERGPLQPPFERLHDLPDQARDGDDFPFRFQLPGPSAHLARRDLVAGGQVGREPRAYFLGGRPRDAHQRGNGERNQLAVPHPLLRAAVQDSRFDPSRVFRGGGFQRRAVAPPFRETGHVVRVGEAVAEVG